MTIANKIGDKSAVFVTSVAPIDNLNRQIIEN